MNIMKSLPLIAAITLGGFAACNYSPECWYYGEGSENTGTGPGAGPGGGVIIPTGPAGVGGYGEGPPKRPQGATDRQPPACNEVEDDATEQPDEEDNSTSCGDSSVTTVVEGETYVFCSGPCESKCMVGGVNGFSPVAFKFSTTVPDDGNGEAGGWQMATTTLSFHRWTKLLPESWECTVTAGMPLRTVAHGKIPAKTAATITAEVATQASFTVMHIKPEVPPGIYCMKFKGEMEKLFAAEPLKNYGARVTGP